jgi:putative membrane protein
MNWGMIVLGGLLMLLFWGGVIALTFFAIRALARPERGPDQSAYPRATPLEILQQRYARGEITREQYTEMRRDLET